MLSKYNCFKWYISWLNLWIAVMTVTAQVPRNTYNLHPFLFDQHNNDAIYNDQDYFLWINHFNDLTIMVYWTLKRSLNGSNLWYAGKIECKKLTKLNIFQQYNIVCNLQQYLWQHQCKTKNQTRHIVEHICKRDNQT